MAHRREDTAGGGARPARRIGSAHRLGPLQSATRETVAYEAISARDGTPDGVAKMARRDRREALAAELRAEGELLRRIHHPAVARGIEVGNSPEHGTFLIRERVDGVDLGTHLRQEGALPLRRARQITVALLDAMQVLEENGGAAVFVDPSDVWVEQGTGRVVVVGAGLAAGATGARRAAGGVADVLAACVHGRLEPEAAARARVRAGVMRDASSGGRRSLPPDLGEIIEVWASPVGGSDVPPLAELRERLAGLPVEPDGPGGAGEPASSSEGVSRLDCRARVVQIEGLLRASIDLDVARDRLGLPENLPDLVGRANDEAESAGTDWGALEGDLRVVVDQLVAVLTEMARSRAASLSDEWRGLVDGAGDLVEDETGASVRRALDGLDQRIGDAQCQEIPRALEDAREALAEARRVTRAAAERHARDATDALVRELDRLEERFPGTGLDAGLEPRRVRAEAQALLDDGKLQAAVRHVRSALAAASTEHESQENAALQATARALADRAVDLRRKEASDPLVASAALDLVEARLAEMVELLGRGSLAEAREVAARVESDLKRLDWERELASPGFEDAPATGVSEVDEVRRAAELLEREPGDVPACEALDRALRRLEETAAEQAADAFARVRHHASSRSWPALVAALSDLRAALADPGESAAPLEDRGFRPSAELREVLRVLAEADRDAPPPSADEAERLRALRERGEELLAQLDAEHARAVAPELVDWLMEHCAAASEAERRGEHGDAIVELTRANEILSELVRETTDEAPAVLPQDGTGHAPDAAAPGSREGVPSLGDDASPEPGLDDPVRGPRPLEIVDDGYDAPGGSWAEEEGTEATPSRGWRAYGPSRDRRPYAALALAFAALAWWTWGPRDWWSEWVVGPRGTDAAGAPGARVPPVAGLFPTITASEPTRAVLRAGDLPSHLRIAVQSVSRSDRPMVVWWLGRRVIARGVYAIEPAPLVEEAVRTGAPVRVTLGAGTRARQAHVWRFEE